MPFAFAICKRFMQCPLACAILHLLFLGVCGRWCLPGEHIEGDWKVISANGTDADGVPWPCCGWEADNYAEEPLCGKESRKPYQWVGGHGCLGGCARKRGLIHAKWVPSKCELHEFNPRAFCKLVRNKTLLFIGDSMMQQYHAVLFNSLVGLSCRHQLPFGHSDTGVTVDFGHLYRGGHWLKFTQDFQPDVVFMALGPHIYGKHNWTQLVQIIVAEYLTLRSPPKLVWVTNAPGGCGKDILPDLPSRLGIKFGKYNYDEGEEKDRIAKEIVGRHFTILDVQPLYRRVDAHPGSDRIKAAEDCMHYCASARGPLALVPQLMYHSLLHVLR